MKKFVQIFILLVLISKLNSFAQCGYSPTDALIIPQSANIETNSYSNEYSCSDWLTFPNAKQINSDKDNLFINNSNLFTVTNSKIQLINILYDGTNVYVQYGDYPKGTQHSQKVQTLVAASQSDNIYIRIYGDDDFSSTNINIDYQNITQGGNLQTFTISGADGFNNSEILWSSQAAYKSNNCIRITPSGLTNLNVTIEKINLYIYYLTTNNSTPINYNPGGATILAFGCANLTIRDCYLMGYTSRQHILIDGCAQVFIDKIRIEGAPYNSDYYVGDGIRISNFGGQGTESGVIQWTGTSGYGFNLQYYQPLKWLVVQNCYFKNLNVGNSYQNFDGLASDRPAKGIVFNCYFENWYGDAIDWAYRNWQNADGSLITCNADNSYNVFNDCAENDVSRVERCIFYNCFDAKYEGEGPNASINGPTIFCTNNIYFNTPTDDYHSEFNVYHVNETFYLNNSYLYSSNSSTVLGKGYGMYCNTTYPGYLYYINNLFYQDPTDQIIPTAIFNGSVKNGIDCQPNSGSHLDYLYYQTIYNGYINYQDEIVSSSGTHKYFYADQTQNYNFSSWKTLPSGVNSNYPTQDLYSLTYNQSSTTSMFNIDADLNFTFNPNFSDNILLTDINNSDINYLSSSTIGMSVAHDFYKIPRNPFSTTTVTMGAIQSFQSGIEIWTGNTSTDWNDGTNWLSGVVPVSTDQVLIMAATNEPVVSNYFNTSSTGTCSTITINPGASLSVGYTDIYNVVWPGTFTCENNLLINSDVTGTGGFLQTDGSTVSIGGNVTVQRYLAEAGDHYITAPMSGINVGESGIGGISGFTMLNSLGTWYNPNNTYNSIPNLWRYDEGHTYSECMQDMNGWLSPVTTEVMGQGSTPATTPEGNLVGYVFEISSPTTISMTNPSSYLNTGGIAGTIYKEAASSNSGVNGECLDIDGITNGNTADMGCQDVGTGPTNGWHIVGNPYPCPIDWNAVIDNGGVGGTIGNAIYFYQPTGAYGIYVYEGLANGGLSFSVGLLKNYPGRYIPAMQAFLINNSTIGTPTLTLENADRTVSTQASGIHFDGLINNDNLSEITQIYLNANKTNYADTDVAILIFKSDTSKLFAFEYDNTAANTPNLYFMNKSNGSNNYVNYQLLTRSDIQDYLKIQLGFNVNSNGSYTINASNIQNIPDNMHVFIKDNAENVIQDLNINPTYVFNFNEGDAQNRFYLIFSSLYFTAQPQNSIQCAGESVTFNTTVSEANNVSYQWYFNSNLITNATNTTFNIQSVALSNAGQYTCVASNSHITITSDIATLTVNTTSPLITEQPISSTQCYENEFEFDANATGSSPLIYNWYMNDSLITNVSGSVLAFYGLSTENAGNYYTIVSNACGSSTSNIATLTINTPPTIIYQSGDTTSCEGVSASLNVTATGTGLSYQWYQVEAGNWIPETGGTNSTYSPSTSTVGNFNYYCIINGTCAPVDTSNSMNVTVNAPPSITSVNPGTQTDCQNGSATNLTIAATGAGLTYQWYSNTTNSNSGGISLSGATNTTYTPSTITVGTLYYYSVVSGSCTPIATSSTVTVTVNALPSITSINPGTQTECQNSTPTNLTVAATGAGTLTYQWYSNTTNSNSGGTSLSGAINTSYTPSTSTAGTLYYYCVVNGSCTPAATSTTVSVTINAPPSISSISPATQTDCKNGSATGITLSANGAGLSYQWYSNTTNSNSGGTLFSGGTNSTYSPSTSAAGTLYYYCKVSGICSPTATSSTASVIVNAPPSITSISPSQQILCQNNSANNFTISANGAGLSYQWYFNTSDVNSGGTIINGATSATYLPSTSTVGQQFYYCIVNGSCSPAATSTVVGVWVMSKPFINSISPGTQTDCKNGSTTTITLNSYIGLYQWYYNNTNSNSGGTSLSGATTSAYTPSSSASGTLYYYCTVGNLGCSITSSTVTVTINAPPSITSISPSTQSVCQNGTATNLSISATGAGLAYQWYSNTTNSNSGGTSLSGTTNSTYTPSTSTAGTLYYYCIVSGSCTPVATSATVTVTINADPNVSNFSISATTPHAGSASTVTVNSTSLGNATFTVTYNLSGANTATGDNASMTISNNSSGTFSTVTLADSGSTTITITAIAYSSTGCSSNLTSGNTTTIDVMGQQMRKISMQNNPGGIESDNITVKIYPNPNDGSFTMDIVSQNDGNIEIEGYNIIGRKVLSEAQYLQKGESLVNLKINNPAPGIYLINIRNDKEVINRKVVVE